MTTPFQDAAAAASGAVDDVYGEPYLYQPMKRDADVNGRLIVDPDRAPVTVTGVPFDAYARADSGPARTQGVTAEKPGHASDRPSVSIERAALPYAPHVGDRLTRVSDGVKFSVAEPRRLDLVRIVLDLNRL